MATDAGLAVLDSFRLDGRVAVVTGASSGLGVVFARAMSAAGAAVVVAARREERLQELAARLAEGGREALAVRCDVTDRGDVARLCERTLEEFGRVDVLIANAGVSDPKPAESEPEETFRWIVDVNLHGVFWCNQSFGAAMLGQDGGGSIVNVASVLGLVGGGQIPQASYTASKGAVVNMTRELAAQWARRGVRVNALAPGFFESEMTEEMFASETGRNWIRKRTPMGRAGAEHELAAAALFLASDASSYVTGQTLAVDGGWTIV
ncbi:MAG: SDR family NAD(P)-dependent oxidoreductase [Acidobacteria bacterium]|nr:MAG: SDR family NAD(P)-dependent oxidoreductase [Acidobacteriota bacterium]REK04634.1 MAG: SDR family NAD(P)-dependent oxidoreductase [Acidobacteriota bacterium]